MPRALVPEPAVLDWRASRDFYVDVLGFSVVYDRPNEEFAYLRLGAADLMIDQIGRGRSFDGGHLPDARPFGRGMNLQIAVPSVATLLASIKRQGLPLFLPQEEKWYRRKDDEVGQLQFIVADPDGYLLRFCEDLGTRPAAAR